MPAPDREQVYQSLIDYLNGVVGPNGSADFKTVNRRIVPLTSNIPGEGPFLFQQQMKESIKPSKGVPPIRTFHARLWIYVNFGEATDTVPSTILNDLVTAVEEALAPQAFNDFQQLNIDQPAISSCLINGEIEYFEGVLGQWGVALIPVELVAVF